MSVFVHPYFRRAHRVFAQDFPEAFAPLVGADGPEDVGDVGAGVDLKTSTTHPHL